MNGMSAAPPPPYEQFNKSIEIHEPDLWMINRKIWENPELGFEEVQAHDNISDLLEKLGYTVTRHAHGIATSFEVEYGSGGRVVTFNAEYDALPGIGHACGHNLIATGSIGAFLATADALKADSGKVPGRVRLLGTPAEEGGGGKVDLIEAGAYKDADACLMCHPMPLGFAGLNDGAAIGSVNTRRSTLVTFTGKNAHAAAAPWDGINALDAVVATYMNVSLLRQQLYPFQRVHAAIYKGGERPNVIPDSTTMEFYARSETTPQTDELCDKLSRCFEGAAQATGCRVEYKWDTGYKDIHANHVLADSFVRHMNHFGRSFLEEGPGTAGSTDMGNVSYELPGFHGSFGIPCKDPEAMCHQPSFAQAAGTPESFQRALDCAKGMAATAYGILTDPELAEEAWQEWRRDFEK